LACLGNDREIDGGWLLGRDASRKRIPWKSEGILFSVHLKLSTFLLTMSKAQERIPESLKRVCPRCDSVNRTSTGCRRR
jgi:hypothetical protein